VDSTVTINGYVGETDMLEGLFQPFHLLVILFIAVISYGMPFLAGYFLGRYVEAKKLRKP
jgi:hypothetical protein